MHPVVRVVQHRCQGHADGLLLVPRAHPPLSASPCDSSIGSLAKLSHEQKQRAHKNRPPTCLSLVVCCLLFVVCCSLFVVCCWLLVRSTTKPTGNWLTSNPTKEETIPNTTHHHTPQQSFIPLPNTSRVKQLQRAKKVQQWATLEALPTAKISSNLTAPGIKNSNLEMLHRTSQVTKKRQHRTIPTHPDRIPPKTNLRGTGGEQVNRPMTWTPFTNHLQQTINSTYLSWSWCKIPAKQTEPKPYYTKGRNTPRGPIQQAKDSTNTSQRLTTRP